VYYIASNFLGFKGLNLSFEIRKLRNISFWL